MNQSMTYEEFQARVGSVILTEKGTNLLPIFYAISQWGMKYILEQGAFQEFSKATRDAGMV